MADPYCYIVESFTADLKQSRIQAVWTATETKAEFEWLDGPKRVIPVRAPLPSAAIAAMWQAAAIGGAGMGRLEAFANLIQYGAPLTGLPTVRR